MSTENQISPDGASPRSPLDLPRPTVAQIIARALLLGLLGGAILSLMIVSVFGVASLASGGEPTFYSLAYLGGVIWLFAFATCFFLGILAQSRNARNRAFTVTGFLATFFGLLMLFFFFRGLLTDVVHWFYYQPLLVAQTNWLTQKNQKEFEDAQAIYQQEQASVLRFLQQELEGVDKDDKEERRKITEDYLGPNGKLDEKGEVVQPTIARLREQAIQERKSAKSDVELIRLRNKFRPLYIEAGGILGYRLFNSEITLIEKQDIANRPLRDTSASAVLSDFLLETPDPAPESVGIRPALIGSLWLAFIMILFAVPIGVGAALYLEEYRSEGRLARIIQININNLAGVPSIVFGILGAFVFVELIFKRIHLLNHNISVRNVIGGGLTLALLTLPVVIVAAQEAIRAVPNSIRQGAYALGATHWQVIWHQVLPMARPGILTGTILAVSRAIGEAAPLVLFGATTFVAYNPTPVSDFTVLPIQIYNWAERSTNPTIDRIAAVTDKGVHVFEALSGRTLGRLKGHESGVNSAAFNHNGHFLVTAGNDQTVRVWDSYSYEQIDVLRKHDGPVTIAAMHYMVDQRWIVSGDQSGKVILWKRELATQENTGPESQDRDPDHRQGAGEVDLPGHTAAITCIALSSDGNTAITGSMDRTLNLWDLKTGKRIVTFTKHTGPVLAVRFGPSGTVLSAGQDGVVRQWDIKGKELKVFQGEHKGAVNAIAFTQTVDYKRLITGGADKKVLAWDFDSGKVVQTFPEHGDEVTAVDVIQRPINGYDFLAVASASKDQTIRYSELVTGKEMQTMQGRHGAIASVAFDPAGYTVNAWHNNMALASLVLLVILLLLNAVAIVLRNRAQQRVRV